MTDQLPWIVYPFTVSMGLLLVVGVVAAVVGTLARARYNRFVYGLGAVVGFVGCAFQVATLVYYLAPTETTAIDALRWQVDCAAVLIAAMSFWVGLELYRHALPSYLLPGFMFVVAVLIVVNRLTPFSVHFGHAQPVVSHGAILELAELRHLRGDPAWASYFWHGVAIGFLTIAIYWAGRLIAQGRRRRGAAQIVMLLLQIGALAYGLMMDVQHWDGVYPLGFSAALFLLWMSCGVGRDAAARSRRLIVRERQMESEILQRRKAENKLERLSQVFTQAPTPAHIVDLSGKVLQVNEESVRFLRRDVSIPPKVNFLTVLERLGERKEKLLDDLRTGKVRHYGPYHFAAGIPVDSLYLVRDAWLTFKVYPILDNNRALQELVVHIEDVTERQFVDNAIRLISSAVSAETGQAFFTQLVVNLARLLNKKYVFIGLKTEQNGAPCITTQAAAIDSEIVDNITIPLGDSPSQKVLERGVYVVQRQVCAEYPGHALLRDLGVQSYLGIAITNQDRRRIGVLAVADVKPMEHIDQLQEIVNIFVARAGTELQRIEAEKQIRKMAYEDYLTGLPNRAFLHEHITGLLAESAAHSAENPTGVVAGSRPRRLHAFLQIDLDHFKTINDALGHDVGDEVLRHIASRFRHDLKDVALISRIGGDEFALVFENLPSPVEANIARLAQQVIALTEQPVKVQEHLLDLGCTMGVVTFPDFAETAVDVFRHADIALNRSKSSGRGGYQLFTPAMRQSVSARLVLEKGLRQAITNKEFHLFYQPQVGGDGRLVGAEALIRWRHPNGAWISPAEFIPVAEETGLINLIGGWVLETAVQHRKQWAEQKLPFFGHLSINVSPWQFARPDFIEGTMQTMDKLNVPPSHITLEVTESALLTDINDTIEKLSQLQRKGFSIALDDFGTGYSSLAYLRDLPLDILKIDKSFVDALETNVHEPLVESMISIGRYMGLQVIAEGVETPIQMQRLTDLGCDVFQGYLFSRPLPHDDFVDWLQNRVETPSQ